MDRVEMLQRLQGSIAEKRALIGASAGMGLSAKCEHAAGVDFITTSAEDYFFMQGRGEGMDILPIGDCNGIVEQLAAEVLSMAKDTPVLAGVFANDTFRDMKKFLMQLKERGFTGVLNSPSMESVDGYARKVHDSVKINFDREVEMIRIAAACGLVAAGVCYTAENAEKMARAGADLILANVPADTALLGETNRETALLAVSARLQKICDAARTVKSDALILAHSKLIRTPEELVYVLEHTDGLVGYHGSVTIEGYPVKAGIRNQIAAFKAAAY